MLSLSQDTQNDIDIVVMVYFTLKKSIVFLFLIKHPFLHGYKQLEKEIITTLLNK